jgi:hypothetical protein
VCTIIKISVGNNESENVINTKYVLKYSFRDREKHFVVSVPNSPKYFFALNFIPVHALSQNL